MLAHSSELFELLQRIDADVFGAVFILSTIGIFITTIVTVTCVSRTWNNLAMMRMSQSLVKDLVERGYSVDEIERLAYGPRWDRQFKKMVRSASHRMSNMMRRNEYAGQPMPPVKQPVHS